MTKFYDVCGLVFLSFFSLFAFSMFAPTPTGVATTSSSLAFLAAIPLFIKFLGHYRLSSTETMGLVLFCFLFASIFWGSTTFADGPGVSLGVPYFPNAPGICWGNARGLWRPAAGVGCDHTGAAVSLLISYGMSLGWWPQRVIL